ncbi:MAG: hypothetical protein P9M07_06600 [Candidatus Aceula meridiana]|nr:hypothetical protein [Candidatus Aceula meridiana]
MNENQSVCSVVQSCVCQATVTNGDWKFIFDIGDWEYFFYNLKNDSGGEDKLKKFSASNI